LFALNRRPKTISKLALTQPSYVQVIPLFLPSDTDVSRYFREYTDEIDEVTGPDIMVAPAEEVNAGDTRGIVNSFRRPVDNGRFPGLRLRDLPCLWIEDNLGGRAILPLPKQFEQISQLLRIISDVAQSTKTAEHIKSRTIDGLKDYEANQSPIIRSILSGDIPVSKSKEKLIAVICGVIFVSVILVISILIPNPSPFQYTVFRIVLALAAAGFVSMTPGFIEAKISNWLRAGGALAVFVIVFFYSPAAIEAINVSKASGSH
jgi:hypothetical protein